MVQLKPINGKFTVVSETDFNSMMVQLKRSCVHLPRVGLPNFNSMMVQLKLYTGNEQDKFTVFQFHDGTIKTL